MFLPLLFSVHLLSFLRVYYDGKAALSGYTYEEESRHTWKF